MASVDVLEPELASESTGAESLMALNRSEIDVQISTAKQYPRSIKEFVREATEMVTLTEDVAGDCMYALKRGGKTIEGPSARFAEIVASAWGNCRAGARVIGEDDRFVTSQGACFDLQRNVAITYEVKRRITNREGKKYADDMVGVTSNAACSIALRNAILKVIPKAFWKPIYDEARKTAVGTQQTLSAKRGSMLEAFAKMGADEATILAYLEVPGVADITLDHLAVLRGVFTSIKDGETSVDEAFAKQPQEGSRARRSPLNDPQEPPAGSESDGNADGQGGREAGAKEGPSNSTETGEPSQSDLFERENPLPD